MGKLPVCSGKEVVKTFEKDEWVLARYIDDHFILKKKGVRYLLSVPDHKPIKPGTLRRLIKDAEITVDEFIVLLGRGSKKGIKRINGRTK